MHLPIVDSAPVSTAPLPPGSDRPANDLTPDASAPPVTHAAASQPVLSQHETRIVEHLARAALPAFGRLPGADERIVPRLGDWLANVPATVRRSYKAGLWALEGAAVFTHGKPFTKLPPLAQGQVLQRHEQSSRYVERALLQGLVVPLKWLHFDAPHMHAHVGCRYDLPAVKDESPRWMAQVTNGREVEEDMELECEVVVIGTGAGGAAAAYELASRGRAVLLLEEGDLHRRSKFRGRPSMANREMYRDQAMTISLGNVGIPVWAGRAVGGSTVVNSGTCYRTPGRVFERWQEDLGLPADFSEEGLSPYYDRVERMLGVAQADPKYVGRIAGLIARGADRLGYSHGILRRNAPGCDGQGVCCFGCPTGAKRSTDVSYVPEALLRGAQLITAARVTRVDIEGGRPSMANREMYRDQAMTISLGNVGIPVWAGRAVGGSTVVNSGTCYRTPGRVFERWQEDLGLPADFSEEGLSPYYDRVERMLGVAQADPKYVGRIAGLIARGADRLGYSHGILRRNAPGCDGQGVCCFGCPTGAKRSTDVSYVPEALLRGAQLITAARVTRVDIEGGRARGVTAELAGANGKRTLRVKAEAVVVAGGTLMTPLLLRRSGACRTSRMLGKNLSIHPASKVLALFDERVEQWDGIPQSYTIDQFKEEGLLFEGASVPYELAATAIPWIGPRYMELMEQFPHLATFGFMIADTSRGEVREGPNGSPLMLYNLNRHDTARMQKGLETLTEIFQAAGARRVFPFAAGHDDVSTRGALERLRSSRLKPGDFDVTAFHPLGTCRVGADPRSSCIGPDHEAHDVGGLYVTDGSAIPSSLGVNPQMTIMAMSLRAAEIIDSRLG